VGGHVGGGWEGRGGAVFGGGGAIVEASGRRRIVSATDSSKVVLLLVNIAARRSPADEAKKDERQSGRGKEKTGEAVGTYRLVAGAGFSMPAKILSGYGSSTDLVFPCATGIFLRPSKDLLPVCGLSKTLNDDSVDVGCTSSRALPDDFRRAKPLGSLIGIDGGFEGFFYRRNERNRRTQFQTPNQGTSGPRGELPYANDRGLEELSPTHGVQREGKQKAGLFCFLRIKIRCLEERDQAEISKSQSHQSGPAACLLGT
jgi:hypothetical protein